MAKKVSLSSGKSRKTAAPRAPMLVANPRSEVDEHAVTELILYADNDADVYRQSEQPILANLKKKIAKGQYSPVLAEKAWAHWADVAAKKYTKDFDGRGGYGAFSASTRREAARRKAREVEEELRVQGELGAKRENPWIRDPRPTMREVWDGGGMVGVYTRQGNKTYGFNEFQRTGEAGVGQLLGQAGFRHVDDGFQLLNPPGGRECPECGEPIEPGRPRQYGSMLSVDPERLRWRHLDGERLCDVMTSKGYQPALPGEPNPREGYCRNCGRGRPDSSGLCEWCRPHGRGRSNPFFAPPAIQYSTMGMLGALMNPHGGTRLRDVPTGALFRFTDRPTVYVARGSGWYGSPTGYDGGPWSGKGPDGYSGSFNPEVVLVDDPAWTPGHAAQFQRQNPPRLSSAPADMFWCEPGQHYVDRAYWLTDADVPSGRRGGFNACREHYQAMARQNPARQVPFDVQSEFGGGPTRYLADMRHPGKHAYAVEYLQWVRGQRYSRPSAGDHALSENTAKTIRSVLESLVSPDALSAAWSRGNPDAMTVFGQGAAILGAAAAGSLVLDAFSNPRTVNTGWRKVTPGKCMDCGSDDDWSVDGRGNVLCGCQACTDCGLVDAYGMHEPGCPRVAEENPYVQFRERDLNGDMRRFYAHFDSDRGANLASRYWRDVVGKSGVRTMQRQPRGRGVRELGHPHDNGMTQASWLRRIEGQVDAGSLAAAAEFAGLSNPRAVRARLSQALSGPDKGKIVVTSEFGSPSNLAQINRALVRNGVHVLWEQDGITGAWIGMTNSSSRGTVASALARGGVSVIKG